jgi:hypothetical protein
VKTQFPDLLRALVHADIEFIVIGAAAAIDMARRGLQVIWISSTAGPRRILIELSKHSNR